MGKLRVYLDTPGVSHLFQEDVFRKRSALPVGYLPKISFTLCDN